MRIVIMGPQGSGKGTQGKRLAGALGIPFVGMGDLFRRIAKEPSELGREISQFMQRGEMVPDKHVVEVLIKGIYPDARSQGFVLDGYPRREGQVTELDDAISPAVLDRVILLDVSLDEAMRRAQGRQVCTNPDCGAIYGVDSAPQTPPFCDQCQGDVRARADDTPDALKRRYAHYESETVPAIRAYEARGLLVRVDGIGEPSEVHRRVMHAMSVTKG